ncbi:hypothetical protein NDU88_002113 [Pleurodeles waltl]|uniref:Uncharacterized protein n=1 Tax=Pleurodeles waltl TaxID=8319 RepID=A0AAV7M182_PLEWA|nr:hypothetical protein NDU88_002113 [Pleurodeles waltl]
MPRFSGRDVRRLPIVWDGGGADGKTNEGREAERQRRFGRRPKSLTRVTREDSGGTAYLEEARTHRPESEEDHWDNVMPRHSPGGTWLLTYETAYTL